MIAGHFGFAAAVKARSPSTPLWALMLACQWLDVVFVPLFVAGIERIEPVPGSSGRGYGDAIIYADYTHSLLGALLLSLLFAVPFVRRRGLATATVLASVVFSHWLLDLLMHRSDMPLLPGAIGGLPRLGFGLWRSVLGSAVLELLLVVVGAALYFRAAREVAGKNPQLTRRAAYCALAILLAGVGTLGLNLFGL